MTTGRATPGPTRLLPTASASTHTLSCGSAKHAGSAATELKAKASQTSHLSYTTASPFLRCSRFTGCMWNTASENKSSPSAAQQRGPAPGPPGTAEPSTAQPGPAHPAHTKSFQSRLPETAHKDPKRLACATSINNNRYICPNADFSWMVSNTSSERKGLKS